MEYNGCIQKVRTNRRPCQIKGCTLHAALVNMPDKEQGTCQVGGN